MNLATANGSGLTVFPLMRASVKFLRVAWDYFDHAIRWLTLDGSVYQLRK